MSSNKSKTAVRRYKHYKYLADITLLLTALILFQVYLVTTLSIFSLQLAFLFLQTIGANGVVGSLDGASEECPACLKGTCRSFNGLYTRSDLPVGYSVITQIPKGACKIFVQQLKYTKNFLGKCIHFFYFT